MVGKKEYFLFFPLFLLLVYPFQLYTDGPGNGGGNNMIETINYHYAFDQKALHSKYKDLMVQLGAYQNVSTEVLPDAYLNVTDTVNSDIEKLYKEYVNACLAQLNKAHRSAIMRPAYNSLALLGLVLSAAGIVKKVVPNDSLGGSFSIFSTVNNAVFLFGDVIRSGFSIAFLPSHALNALEEHFAKNQCFIPNALWPIIIEKFTLARQNQFEQRNTMNFIEFVLGFTTYQKPLQPKADAILVDSAIQEINRRIDNFFAQYSDESDDEYRSILKINITKFILALTGNVDVCPRYVYLHGPGGIGKTHFVSMLAQWIDELLPETIYFNDVVITNEQELEGTAQQPGAMLRIVRNQLIRRRRGSLVFMDEATWLNKEDMISSAKRVFNGNQSKLSTSYFGLGMDGTGIELNLSPTLIFVASNEDIADPALASRFDIITFPQPTVSLLVSYAMNVINKSNVLIGHKSKRLVGEHDRLQEDLESWIIKNKIKNFRAVESKIEQYMMAKAHKN